MGKSKSMEKIYKKSFIVLYLPKWLTIHSVVPLKLYGTVLATMLDVFPVQFLALYLVLYLALCRLFFLA